jgi:phytoene dehydrogenase-like protein
VDLVLNKMQKVGFDLRSKGVIVQKNRSPKDIGDKWGTYMGNIYGMASHGLLKGGFKTKNSGLPFKNCQLAGGTVNPGAGVPMSIMSGMIAGSNFQWPVMVSSQRKPVGLEYSVPSTYV